MTIYTMTASSQKHKAIMLLKRRGVMRLAELKAAGVNPITLSRMVEEGSVARPGRGLYELSDAEVSLAHGFAEVAVRVPKGVICLISALDHHGITLQNPRSIWVAIAGDARKPKIDHRSVRFVRFGGEAMTLGIEKVIIDGVTVPIFSAAKTIVDCFRFRSLVGLDVALEALRLAVRQRKATPAEIARLAKELRIWSVMRPYLESVAADDA